MLEHISVNLDDRSYNIYIGSKILNNNTIQRVLENKKKYVLITNTILKNIISDINIYNSLFLSKIDQIYLLNDSECHKNIQEIESMITFLLKNSYGRDTTLIALGGGVIGDMTGFVASIYQRGINFIQIPTTLLAQVDASIGGKTGVNHNLGKNMIGSFWQPSSVFIDINFLSFLSKKQILSGIAEIIKYAIILDYDFFVWLEKHINLVIQLQKKELLYCIKKCCEIKSKIISKDETEKSDRVLLNLGHSFAHAIETYTKYNKWLHGYAVASGIVLSAYLANSLNILNNFDLIRIVKIFYKIGLPIIGPQNMSVYDYLNLIRRDKKVLDNKIRLVLPVSIGVATVYTLHDESELIVAIQNCYKKKSFKSNI
ncbi:3-dehydroquinate synthase [Buchnera aphidicola (Cinara tujafilina)]|uniref:3-dehydroquinate synthase n=1 Tax=Buchnera aphidicola (Cinara tujafilina) TaxID=261317 RepID=F7WZQ2_9GAMM|nr:3-dehydroquinate synthase [Buchnera aphidicola]AEH39928.1 3-dehydroquinate synthase [Buchnera aphidicola (Cinara tujafilina)]